MKVAIFGQAFYPESAKYLREIISIFKSREIDYIFEEKYYELISKHNYLSETGPQKTFSTIDDSYDLFFSLGGDGTILSSVKFVLGKNVPIVGINTGRLGFLATIHKKEVHRSVNEILDRNYSISQRSVIEVTSSNETFNAQSNNFALNEVTISRKNSTSMICIDAWIDKEHIGKYWADGLIISTPTGSTGYSLSCGGPIITPKTQAFVLSPIAPHNLNARPLVIPDDSHIELKISSREKQFLLSTDSTINTLSPEDIISVKKADFNIKIATHKSNSFLQTLRTKLLWGKDERN